MTPHPQPKEQWECDHYDVCHVVHISKNHICPSNPDNKTCDYDTRSRHHTPAAPDKLYQNVIANADEIRAEERNQTLDRLDKEIAIRENEMNRKGNLEDNLTTAAGYFTAAGALNWVRVVLIDGSRDTIHKSTQGTEARK